MEALIDHCVIGFAGGDRGKGKALPTLPPSSSHSSSRRRIRTSSSAWIPPLLLRNHSLLLDRNLKLKLLLLRPINSLPSSTAFPAATPPPRQVDDDSIVSQLQTAEPHKTVRVRFVLQKECVFGQQFILVGDIPALGFWDPSDAIPLEWSDGHVWTAELDLPIKKEIRFKFILRGISGEVEWQPGPDRILEPWDTSKTIIVTEDWENAENQMISEMESLGAHEKETTTEFKIGSNGQPLIVAAQNVEALEIQEDIVDGNSSQKMHHDEKTQDMVLIPGLVPIPASNASSPTASTPERFAPVSAASAEANECDLVQLLGKDKEIDGPSGDQLREETIELLQPAAYVYEEQPKHDNMLATEDLQSKETSYLASSSILSNDMQWGRKVWEKFLSNLGFNANPTEM